MTSDFLLWVLLILLAIFILTLFPVIATSTCA